MDEFSPVFLTEIVMAVLSDGRWYSSTVLRRRLKTGRGVMVGTLDRLRRQGFIHRALNPRNSGRPHWKTYEPVYVYQATGEPFEVRAIRGMEGHLRERVRWDFMPQRWRNMLK